MIQTTDYANYTSKTDSYNSRNSLFIYRSQNVQIVAQMLKMLYLSLAVSSCKIGCASGVFKQKIAFLLGTPLGLHYLCPIIQHNKIDFGP